MSDFLLSVKGLSKSYDAVQALRNADIEVGAGEIHGLVGENGAGKSTLIKVLAGVVSPDGGTVEIGGTPFTTGSVAASERAGMCVVHQESTAFRDLGLAENLLIGHEPRRLGGLLLDKTAMRSSAKAQMEAIGQAADFSAPLGDRSLAQQQLVAIARAVSTQCRLIILDEPTASLSVREVETLKGVLRSLAAQGVSVLYVSHRLDEVFDLCERVTVLRDGQTVARSRVADLTQKDLILAMVGRQVGAAQRNKSVRGRLVLSVTSISKDGAFEDVSFDAYAGEILGIGGLVGSGRSEVLCALFGTEPFEKGAVTVLGNDVDCRSPEGPLAAGVALVPEDRQHQGLILGLSVAENLSMSIRRSLSRWGFVRREKEKANSEEFSKALAIRAPSLESPVHALSGGNQQKVSLGKWLATTPTVLLVDEPTRGVDVGAKSEIHELVRRKAEEGVAVVMVSSDLPELVSLSDRVLVMHNGSVAGILEGMDVSSERVLQLAFGSEGES